jgi:hypothetical protein
VRFLEAANIADSLKSNHVRKIYNFDAEQYGMEFLQQLFLYVSFTALVFLLIGLYKPWVMLWWEDVQNRRKVIKVYGAVSVVCLVMYFAMNLIIK